MLRPFLLLLPALAYAADCSPNAAEQQTILDAATESARNYTQALPNFLATRETKRFLDSSGSGHQWKQTDASAERLTYFDHKEVYTAATTNEKVEAHSGLTSGGEFGAIFEDIFDPRTLAEFTFKHCRAIHSVAMYVFEYHETKALSVVGFATSQPMRTNSMSERDLNRRRQMAVPYHGVLFIDRTTNKVMRITSVAEIPRDFPMRNLERQIDYGWTPVAGGEFLLPQRVEVNARLGYTLMRNEVTFVFYRKFEADSNLKFEKQ